MAQRLDRLLNDVDVYERPVDARRIEITGLTEKLQDVTTGSLFFCVKGAHVDGHDFAPQAADQGAAALVVARMIDGLEVPQVQVSDVRAAMAPIAAEFYDQPGRKLRIAGITGTNGKTTTTELLATILRHHRWSTMTIGTLSGHYTSPPAIDLQRLLSEAVARRDHAVVMEASSHALDQHRVDAIRFGVGVFTNLTQDHLDYHKTMSRYFEAKTLLFEPGRSDNAVVNIDDEYGRQLYDRLAIPCITYGLEDAEELYIGPNGSRFTWQGQTIQLHLLGKFNVYNALAAASAARAMGISTGEIAEALSQANPVRGRMEQVDLGQPFNVVVDFAHTPDGLENVLTTARGLAEEKDGRVLVVFGAGGDRDAEKRPLMGEVVKRLADEIVVTNDNPRSEDPDEIARQIVAGMADQTHVHVYLDRKQAIEEAIRHAQPNDVVVIAGKGHETTQEINGNKLPFDDRQVATDVLRAMGGQES